MKTNEENVTVWGIHCTIDEESMFHKNSVMAIGWNDMGDLSKLEKTREAFKVAYQKIWPNDSKMTVAVQAGQVYRFACEVKVGDYVVFPSKVDRMINIGVVEGDYFFAPNVSRFGQQRKVKWLKKLPRTAFSQGALYEAGSAMTFFLIKNYAAEYLAALDKGFKKTILEEDETVAQTAEETENRTRDFIFNQLKKDKGYDFEPIVADLLRAMGYKSTKVSKHGGDHGVDIVAYKDELPPRIVIQVKSQDADIAEELIQKLKGAMDPGDYGVFVALSHFKENAKAFLEHTPMIRGIDCDDFIDLFLKYYDKLDEKYQRKIPLRKVFIPNVVDSQQECEHADD